MDCANARILLLFYRPGRTADLTAEDATALETHLAGCPACAATLAKTVAADVAVRPAVTAVAVPAGLRATLLVKTAAIAARAWRAKWLTRATGTAAAGVFGVLSWAGYHWATRPTLDTWTVAAAAEADWDKPEPALREWLKRERIPTPLPEEFDARLLARAGDVELQGVKVPALEFRAGGGFATVYFLRPGAFGTSAAAPAQNSTVTVRVYPDQPAAGWTMLIVHTGPTLQPFLRATQPAG